VKISIESVTGDCSGITMSVCADHDYAYIGACPECYEEQKKEIAMLRDWIKAIEKEGKK
jgi:hypothetical protein